MNTAEGERVRMTVRIALSRGWARWPDFRVVKYSSTMASRRRRARWHAVGLNSRGMKPAKRQWPELAGLVGRERHRVYMRLVRGSKRTYRHWPQLAGLTRRERRQWYYRLGRNGR